LFLFCFVNFRIVFYIVGAVRSEEYYDSTVIAITLTMIVTIGLVIINKIISWSRSGYSYAYFDRCQEFNLACPNFYLPGPFSVIFSEPLSPYSLAALVWLTRFPMFTHGIRERG